MKIIFGVLAILVPAFLFSSCGDEDSPVNGNQTGRFTVRMTDAPGRYEAVNITFSEISAHIDGEWVTVEGDPQTINLLEWNNGKSVVVGQADLPAGTYTQIRLKIDGAEVVKDGETHEMTVPSGAQTGLKLTGNYEVAAGSTYELLVDFDAHRSVVEAGKSGKFLLKPTLRAVPVALTGSISGEVTSTASLPLAIALSGEDTVTSTAVDTTSGDFTLAFLPPGEYTVVVQDTAGAASVQEGVAVTAGADASLGVLELQVGVTLP